MTDNITTVIAEARDKGDRRRKTWPPPREMAALVRRLADTLEATVKEMHARELHHFEEEKLRAEVEAERDNQAHNLRAIMAERDRYRAAVEEIDDWMTRHYLDTHVGGIILAMTARALNENGDE